MNEVRPSNLVWHNSGPFFATHQYMVPEGHSMDDLLDEKYFWSSHSQINGRDRVEFFDEAGTMAGVLCILGVNTDLHKVDVELMTGGAFGSTQESNHKAMIIEFAGRAGWRVLDGETREILQDKFETKALAYDWIDEAA